MSIITNQWNCILSWSPSLYASSSNVPCTTFKTLYYSCSIPNIPPPSPVELDDGSNYEVETILGSKYVLKILYYLVDWLGYTRNGQTWGSYENLTNSTKFILQFHHWFPNKTSPSLCIVTHGTNSEKKGIMSWILCIRFFQQPSCSMEFFISHWHHYLGSSVWCLPCCRWCRKGQVLIVPYPLTRC